MKRTTWIMLGFLLSAGVPGLLVSCAPPAAQQAKQIYHCPMHPNVISDKPGTCKICGMDLVLIEETGQKPQEGKATGHAGHASGADQAGHAAMSGMTPQGYAEIRIDSQRQQLIGVRLATVTEQSLLKQIRVVGEVAHDPDLYQAQEEYLKSLGTGLARSGALKLEHMGMSPSQVSALERSGRAKRNLIVGDRDPRFWVYVYFYEADLPFVRTGQEVTVTVPVLGDAIFTGTLQALRPYIDSATRSVRGIVEVEDREGRLRPGLFVNAQVAVPLPEGPVLPVSAVLDSGAQQIVFVKQGEGVFVPRQVTLAGMAEHLALVQSGVAVGEQVAVGANFMLDSESRLQAVIEQAGQNAAGGHQH